MNLSAIVALLARGLAVAGGLVLVVLTILTVVSITGRAAITIGHSDLPVGLQWLSDVATWLTSLRLRRACPSGEFRREGRGSGSGLARLWLN